jgi:WD40 repeat protein
MPFSPDREILAVSSRDGTIVLWDVAIGRPLGAPLAGHTSVVLDVAFSPDGMTLASGVADGSIVLWNVADRRQIGAPLIVHTNDDAAVTITFSPDGKTLAAAGRYHDEITLWNVADGQQIGAPFVGHATGVASLAFNPNDGTMLAAGKVDGSVILWDVESGQPLGSVLTSNDVDVAGVVIDAVISLTFSPDGATLASSSGGDTIILWDTDPTSWQQRACNRANRNLSPAESTRYLGTTQHEPTCPDLPGEGAGMSTPAA